MFLRVWQYDVVAGCEADFERIYGSDGEWARLFANSDGFVGTELLTRLGEPRGYLTVDRFLSASAWDRFLAENRHQYDALDRQAAGLTRTEQELAAVEDV